MKKYLLLCCLAFCLTGCTADSEQTTSPATPQQTGRQFAKIPETPEAEPANPESESTVNKTNYIFINEQFMGSFADGTWHSTQKRPDFSNIIIPSGITAATEFPMTDLKDKRYWLYEQYLDSNAPHSEQNKLGLSEPPLHNFKHILNHTYTSDVFQVAEKPFHNVDLAMTAAHNPFINSFSALSFEKTEPYYETTLSYIRQVLVDYNLQDTVIDLGNVRLFSVDLDNDGQQEHIVSSDQVYGTDYGEEPAKISAEDAIKPQKGAYYMNILIQDKQPTLLYLNYIRCADVSYEELTEQVETIKMMFFKNSYDIDGDGIQELIFDGPGYDYNSHIVSVYALNEQNHCHEVLFNQFQH